MTFELALVLGLGAKVEVVEFLLWIRVRIEDLDVLVGEGVKLGPVERCTVVVEAGPWATLLLVMEEVVVPPVMWKGKEYWNSVVLASRVSLKPYVAKVLEAGTFHLQVPRVFSMFAAAVSVMYSLSGIGREQRGLANLQQRGQLGGC